MMRGNVRRKIKGARCKVRELKWFGVWGLGYGEEVMQVVQVMQVMQVLLLYGHAELQNRKTAEPQNCRTKELYQYICFN